MPWNVPYHSVCYLQCPVNALSASKYCAMKSSTPGLTCSESLAPRKHYIPINDVGFALSKVHLSTHSLHAQNSEKHRIAEVGKNLWRLSGANLPQEGLPRASHLGPHPGGF